MVEYDVIVVGSGISGMSASIYLKRAGLSVLVIEGDTPGGQLNKAGFIENYPGYSSVRGSDLAGSIFNQVLELEVDYLYDAVTLIDYEKREVSTEEITYTYQYLIIATGRRERKLGLPFEEEYIGRGISFCATCDGALYKGENVVVVGGGNTALSDVIYLSNIVHQVTLIYRGTQLRAEDTLVRRLDDMSNVSVIYEKEISSYLIKDGKLCGVCLNDGEKIDCDGVFLAIGSVPNSELFSGKKRDGYIEVDSNNRTSIEFVYAIGDVVNKGVYQLVTASCDGIIAASDIIKNIG